MQVRNIIKVKDDLKRFFEKQGRVQDAIVLKDISTNISRGFGFVTFEDEEDADYCTRKNNYEIKGKRIDIKKAEPKLYMTNTRTYPLPPQGGMPMYSKIHL